MSERSSVSSVPPSGPVADDWDAIEGVSGWTAKLRSLLQAEASAAAQAADAGARLAVSERLTLFVEHSFPNTPQIKALDDIATRAAIGLLEQNLDERLKSMVARNLELASLAKQVDAGTDEARSSAARIRLARVTRTLTSLNDGVGAFRELRSSLKPTTDRELLETIDKAMVAAQALRTLLERTQPA